MSRSLLLRRPTNGRLGAVRGTPRRHLTAPKTAANLRGSEIATPTTPCPLQLLRSARSTSYSRIPLQSILLQFHCNSRPSSRWRLSPSLIRSLTAISLHRSIAQSSPAPTGVPGGDTSVLRLPRGHRWTILTPSGHCYGQPNEILCRRA